MKHKTVDELLAELLDLSEREFHGPFPYADCWKLISKEVKRYEDLTADLNTYFYYITSHSSGVKNILKWPRERILESQKWLAKSLFERFPKYKPLELLINEFNTPDLYTRMALCERMRTQLLDLFSNLLTAQPSPVAA
ncbi:MAG: YxiJ family protein [Pyrinomonadaceae bacterium]